MWLDLFGRSSFRKVWTSFDYQRDDMSLRPLVDLALGFTGFTIGRELDISLLRRGGGKLKMKVNGKTL
jgi:hypothetical protein